MTNMGDLHITKSCLEWTMRYFGGLVAIAYNKTKSNDFILKSHYKYRWG